MITMFTSLASHDAATATHALMFARKAIRIAFVVSENSLILTPVRLTFETTTALDTAVGGNVGVIAGCVGAEVVRAFVGDIVGALDGILPVKVVGAFVGDIVGALDGILPVTVPPPVHVRSAAVPASVPKTRDPASLLKSIAATVGIVCGAHFSMPDVTG
jgi:hypothetical protein